MTLVLGFAAVNTGNNLLFLIVSALLGFMAITGIFGWANVRGLSAVVAGGDEIYSGSPTFVKVHLSNVKRRLPSFLLNCRVLNHEIPFHLIAGKGEGVKPLTCTFSGRGVLADCTCTVSSPFPVSFFIRRVEALLPGELIVFPAPQRPAYGGAPDGARRSGSADTPHRGYDGEVSKIGDYSGAEPLKMIHWRLSAKHDDLKVKEFSAVSADPVLIDPDLLPGGDLESRLSQAAFLVNSLIRASRPVGLKLKDGNIPPDLSRSHRLRLLRELALW